MTIVATVNSGFTGIITNIATVDSDTPDPNPDNNADTVYSTVDPHADLAIVKTSPDDAVAGDTLTYGIHVVNNGPSNAVNVTISDILPVKLSNGEFSTDGGTIWNAWTSPLSIGDLANGASYDFNVRGLVKSGATGIITNTAVVDSDTPDVNPDNNTSTVTDTVNVVVDLCIIKTGPANVVPGNLIEYSMYVCPGVSDALDVVIKDVIPGELRDPEYSLDAGANWSTWTGTLNVGTVYGGVPFEFLLRATVNEDVTTDIYNVATVSTSTPETDYTNNTDDETTPVEPLADLSIEKIGPTEVVVGDTIQYSITVSNFGPSDAEDVKVNDVLPAGINNGEFLPEDSTTWNTWTGAYLYGYLEVGESFLIQVRGTVDENFVQYGVITNIATAMASTLDTIPENNTDSTHATIIVPPVAVDDSSLNNRPGNDAVLSILNNDFLGDGTTPVPADVVVDLDPDTHGVQTELIVDGEGIWTYNPINGVLTFSPEDDFLDDPTPITYIITETATGLVSNVANVIVTYTCFTLNIQAFLEGPFDENTGLMQNYINNGGMLPGDKPLPPVPPTPAGQPYNTSPWNYNEVSGTKYGDPSVNPDATEPYPDDVVDWVLVSVRQGDSLKSSEIFRCVALMYTDGEIILECPCLKTKGVDKYYILVEHRNHFPIMSTMVSLNGGTELSFDFRYQDSWQLGTPIPQEVGQKQMGAYWVMYGGNGDQQFNSSSPFDINSIDFDVWTDDNGKVFEYMKGDYDMNLDGNSLDDELWINNNGRINFIPR
jgi:uncharacterized repeat protein (TIGR01451 family)